MIITFTWYKVAVLLLLGKRQTYYIIYVTTSSKAVCSTWLYYTYNILYTENVLKSHFANASTRWHIGSSSYTYMYPVVPVLLNNYIHLLKKYSCSSCMLLARAQKKIWMTHTKGWRVMARPSLSSWVSSYSRIKAVHGIARAKKNKTRAFYTPTGCTTSNTTSSSSSKNLNTINEVPIILLEYLLYYTIII